MDAEKFFHLYVNINSLSELALHEIVSQGNPDSTAPVEIIEMSGDEATIETAEMDLSALDGLEEMVEAEHERMRSAVVEIVETSEDESDIRPVDPSNADDGPVDLEQYMAKAYEFENVIRPRATRHFEKHVDRPALEALLRALPKGLPPLTAQLTGEQMRRWLDTYLLPDETLAELVTSIRALDS
jgi:hypothetical protein